MRAGQQERPQRRGCLGGPSERVLVALHGAELVVEPDGELGGEVGVEAGNVGVGSAEAGSAEVGRLVAVQAGGGYERHGCVAGQ